MLSPFTSIYTDRGYIKYSELKPGDRTISFNTYRNCTEYDTIKDIHVADYNGAILKISVKGVKQAYTPDHNLILRRKSKFVYPKAEDKFFSKVLHMLGNEMFEPYRISYDIEDVKWAARLAAHFVRYSETPDDVINDIDKYTKDLCGYEAVEWMNTFLSWILKQRYYRGYMAAFFLKNQYVRHKIYEVAPRAGMGCLYAPNMAVINRPGTHMKMHISQIGDCVARPEMWNRDHHEGDVFDVTTNNGTVLSMYAGRISLVTCRKEEIT